MIPFSPPRIDQKITDSVSEALRSGWITTGPRTKQFERELTAYGGHRATLCVSSGSAGLELVLRWFGVKEGDEVIVPAYTYAATANVVVHCGARPVMVDSGTDFNLSVAAVKKAITPRTKVIMPVDLGGYPCDYDEINALASECSNIFNPSSDVQRHLGRILVLSDAAHSIGATYKGRRTGALTDITVYSFHAVKNLTTAEGGAICLNLPQPFDNSHTYNTLNIKSLHGQNKDALAKTQIGNWKYDIVEAGFKCNMTDLQAAIGLVELARYDEENITRRRQIFEMYAQVFGNDPRFVLPEFRNDNKTTSYHAFLLRLAKASEAQRDAVITAIFAREVAVNVHFKPLPMMTFYRNMGFNITDFPVALDNYSREISLPVYYDLTDSQVETVIKAVKDATEEVMS